MYNTFCCLVCDKQTHLFVLDRRNDHFYRCLCTNDRCTVSHFVACWLCEYNNTGIRDYWYHDHLKQKKHKQQVRKLEATFRNIDMDHSLPSVVSPFRHYGTRRRVVVLTSYFKGDMGGSLRSSHHLDFILFCG